MKNVVKALSVLFVVAGISSCEFFKKDGPAVTAEDVAVEDTLKNTPGLADTTATPGDTVLPGE